MFEELWRFNRGYMAREGQCLMKWVIKDLAKSGQSLDECKKIIHHKIMGTKGDPDE